MATAIKSLSNGVGESFSGLVNTSPVIVLGSAVGAGIGYLIGGVPMAWLAAKISGLVLGILYAMGRPTCVIEPNILSAQNCHSIGRVVTAAGIPPLLIHAIHILLG